MRGPSDSCGLLTSHVDAMASVRHMRIVSLITLVALASSASAQTPSRGKLLGVGPVHAGSGSMRLSGLSSGHRYVRIVLGSTSTTTRVAVRKLVRIT